MSGTITGRGTRQRCVVVKLFMDGVTEHLRHGNVEAGLEHWERVSFDLDLDHQSGGQHMLR